MGGPLEGVNVLDFGAAGVGPWAASLLGFLGANVVKVERPEGEVIRNQAPFQRGVSVAYTAWNMSKKSAEFDMKDPAGKAGLEPLIKQADVMMANLRPGVLERLGLGYQAAVALNPNVVYGSSPGWGDSGPMTNVPGGDPDFQAYSGFGSLSGTEGERAELARHFYHFDLNASGMFASTILLGLLRRDSTGKGQKVDTSHLGCTISLMTSRAAEYLVAGQEPKPLGSASSNTAPHQSFLCLDKHWLNIGVENEEQWRGFCTVIEREDLLDDPRFRTNVDRVANRKALSAEIEPVIASRPSLWWQIQFGKRDVPAGMIYDFETLRNHQQVIANHQVVEMDIPHQGIVSIGGLPWKFSETPATMYPAPAPGANTKELAAQGFAAFGQHPKGDPSHARALGENDAPLKGIRVVDITQGLCGPYASLLLADAGAEVIKVEPPDGDYARKFAPATATGDSAAFVALNRNKQSVVIDLTTDAGKAELHALLRTADVFIKDWSPGEAEHRGFGYEALRESNPRLVVCPISPFGEKGPYRNLKGSELVIQGVSEYTYSFGQIGEEPVRWGADIANGTTGTFAFLGILAALYRRNRDGTGQRVAVSQMGTLMCVRQAVWTVLGDVDRWEGMFGQAHYYPRMYGMATKDKPIYFRLHRANEVEYVHLLMDLGMEEYLGDDRFGDVGRQAVGGGKYAVEVQPIWEAAMAHMTAEEVIALAEKHGAVGIPINTIKEVMESEQLTHLDLMREMEHPVLGHLDIIGPPFKGPWEAPAPAPAPALGQHTPVAAR